jgi:DNA-binding LytR/AlgR family response regulator
MKLRCLIIDDEPMARDILRSYIEDDRRLELVDTCANAFEANVMLEKKDIDVLFLDINMPKLSGLSFYKTLSNPPMVIFTTAYPEYAVEGFEVNAVDYLLKPFTFERFLKAVNKIFDQRNHIGDPIQSYILLNVDKKIHKVKLDEITYMKAQGDYVQVFVRDNTLLVHETLTHILERLPGKRFVRIHKSYVVAIDKFDYIEGNMLILGKTTLPIGNTYRDSFLRSIKHS